MSDSVSRSDVLETYADLYDVFSDNKGIQKELNKVFNKINKIPPAQPDIIACGDCIHWICHDRRCGYWNHGVKPLEWCCHGERRTDE